jgi:predicted RecA/RadA family phage recombinase
MANVQTLKAVFVQSGMDEGGIDYTPVGALAAGDVVDLGNCVGVTKHPIAAGALGALSLYGVFDFLKFTGEAISLWAPVYWDVGTGTATGTIGYSEAVIGKCIKDAAAGDNTVRVLILPTAT